MQYNGKVSWGLDQLGDGAVYMGPVSERRAHAGEGVLLRRLVQPGLVPVFNTASVQRHSHLVRNRGS